MNDSPQQEVYLLQTKLAKADKRIELLDGFLTRDHEVIESQRERIIKLAEECVELECKLNPCNPCHGCDE